MGAQSYLFPASGLGRAFGQRPSHIDSAGFHGASQFVDPAFDGPGPALKITCFRQIVSQGGIYFDARRTLGSNENIAC